MKINIRMSEVVFYRFELEVPDNATEEEIEELALQHTEDGPKDEWITIIEDRRMEDYKKVEEAAE